MTTKLIACAACQAEIADVTKVTIRVIDREDRSDAFDDVDLCESCLDMISDGSIITPRWARIGVVEWSFIDLADPPTCRNCDKRTGGPRYCSATCEGMDRFPAPRGNLSGEPS